MLRPTKTALVAVALASSTLAITTSSAQAVDYANCDQMHHHFKYGVARSKAAAARQARTGHYRPAVKPKIYRQNSESDSDNDGTTCEVTR
jgi:hypothetical protein